MCWLECVYGVKMSWEKGKKEQPSDYPLLSSLFTQVRDKVSVKHKARFNYRPLKLLGRDCCKYLPMDSIIIPPLLVFPNPSSWIALADPVLLCDPFLPCFFQPCLFQIKPKVMLQAICCWMTMQKKNPAGLDFKHDQVLMFCHSGLKELHIDPVGFVCFSSIDVLCFSLTFW